MNAKILASMLALVFIVSAMIPLVSGSDCSDAAGETVVVETSPDFAPYDYYYGDEFAGIDMDILRAIGKDTGINITFRQNNFDSIILSVMERKCDFGASGFTISEERKQNVDFTDSYAVIKQVVVAKIGKDFRGPQDLDGKTISVQTGTSGYDYAESHIGSGTIRPQKGYSEIVLDLLNDKADCEVVDDAVAYAQVAAYPDQLKVYDVLSDAEAEYYGFVFAKGCSLYDTINNSLKKLKNDGTVAKIVDYYAANNFSPDTPSYFDQQKTLYVLVGDDSPFGYTYKGRDAGIEVDILKKIADDMDYRIRYIHGNESQIVDRVMENMTYIGASGFGVSETLKDDINYSKSYMTDGLSLLVPAGSDITDISGKKVAVIKDSVSAGYVASCGAVAVELGSYADVYSTIKTGGADCAVLSGIQAKGLCTQYEGEFSESAIEGHSDDMMYSFILSKDAGVLMEALNKSIDKVKSDGVVDEVAEYYKNAGYSMSVGSLYSDSDSKSWWDKLVDRFTKDFIDLDRYTYIVKGLGNTLKITGLALVIGIVIGVLAASVMSVNALTGRLGPLNKVFRLYVTVIRGTPVMVQLLLIYYVVFASVNMNQILIAAAAFGLNSGAYVAEIVRSGINSVPKGQMEAARSLGLSTGQSMRFVIVPQAIRNILPALGNEGISLIKETSIAGYIGVMELTRAADIIRGQTYDALLPLLVIAIIYLVIVLVLQFFVRRMERRLNNAY